MTTKKSRTTIVASATYIGPPSLGFRTNARYMVRIKGDRLLAQEKQAVNPPILANVYTVGGFLANWREIEIHSMTTESQ